MKLVHPDLKDVADHIREIGLGVLAQAQRNTFFRDNWDGLAIPRIQVIVFGVLQAAHAAELLLKAAIAEQHPLLIFSHLPKSKNDIDLVDFDSLIKSGRTYDYADLPDRVWAATGYKMSSVDQYQSFGKLRNAIQHFAVPDDNLEQQAGEFIYNVIDPFIDHFWALNAFNFCDCCEYEEQLASVLVDMKIPFRPVD